MNTRKNAQCKACRTDVEVPEFTMAFQPIVDIDTGGVYAFEASYALPGAGARMTF